MYHSSITVNMFAKSYLIYSHFKNTAIQCEFEGVTVILLKCRHWLQFLIHLCFVLNQNIWLDREKSFLVIELCCFFYEESIRNINKVNFDHSSSAMTKVGDTEEKVKHFVDNE